ncbi:MAG: bile acid:sodium symporter family protein [Fusobacteriaceae bacterium]
MNFLEKLSNFVGKYMAYIVIVIAVISFFRPTTFMWAIPQISNLLGVVMFGMGMTLTKKDFEGVSKSFKAVAIGFFSQFLIMPLLAFAIAKNFNFPPEIAIGIILVGCCPGGTSSNVMTYLAKGDVPLSLSMTTLSTLFAPIITPVLIYFLAGSWINVSISAMFLSIVKVVLVPIILGAVIRLIFTKFVSACIKILPLVSVTAIVLIVGAVVGGSASKIASTGLIILIAVIIHNGLGYALGYFVSKAVGMTDDKRRAIAIEVGMQNSGLATSLATTHFSPLAAVPGAIFSVWHNISGAILANYWNTKPLKEKK